MSTFDNYNSLEWNKNFKPTPPTKQQEKIQQKLEDYNRNVVENNKARKIENAVSSGKNLFYYCSLCEGQLVKKEKNHN